MQGTEIMCIGFVSPSLCSLHTKACEITHSQNTTAYAPLLWGSADMTQDQARAEAIVSTPL